MKEELTLTITMDENREDAVSKKLSVTPFSLPVILVFGITSEAELSNVEKVQQLAAKDFNEVHTVLCMADEAVPVPSEDNLTAFTKKDINLFGGIKAAARKRISMPDVPLMLVFSGADDKLCKKIIALFPARIIAGEESDLHRELFNFTVKAGSNNPKEEEALYRNLMHYIRLTGVLGKKQE